MGLAKDAPSETVGPTENTLGQHESEYPTNKDENLWIRLMTFVGWYSRETPSSEKLVVLKLDLSILVFGGMREEIGLWGNELNYITATFWASYCGTMIPACYLMTRYPANIVLPSLELGWGLATFGLAWVKNVEAIYAMRFFPNEVARRIALFFIASPGGTMFAGYLQAAAYTNLNGVHGLAGWRWLFIIDGIITIGIAFYVIFPDVPSRKKPLALSEAEHALAQKRIEGLTAPPQLQLSTTIFKRVLGRWHFYAFVILWTILDLNILPGGQPFSLYLRANPDRYSIVQVNTLPTVTAAIMIRQISCETFWIPATITTIPVLIGMILLNVWDVGEKGRLAAFMLQGFMAPMSPMSMGWATVIMANDAEERAVVTASMNAIGQGIMAGAQVGLFPATGAPRWIIGFKSCLGTTVVQLAVIYTILYLSRRDANRQAVTADLEAEFSETQDDGREKAQG
ncbi:hypothetical protein CEP52_015867 [Fusarium oligoseptatum]|uniref:Major facilitator superfamily transporter n=1 Tax=Fusarium oligoseptatum TaxID=2604345 RepID=A0A428S8Y2_9HYPO|nr:hypothetical protein CEP52_015867 [Fusarium oligoseptatum]